jgi:membrane associated rhomboid family serine protease
MYYTTSLSVLEEKNVMDFMTKKGYDEQEVILLKSLNRKIDSFCWKHPRFGIPKLMMYIVIGNILVWLFGQMDTTGTMYSLLYFDPALFCRGQVWRLLTFALVPESSGLLWLAISLYFYYFIGTAIEREWGAGKFTIYYFSGLVLTALYSLILYWISGTRVLVSATYVNLSLFFAFATLWPEQRVLLFFIIPVKMKWLAWVDAAFFLLEIVQYLWMGRIGLALVPVVAMLGYLVFCGGWLVDFLRPSHAKQKAKTIQFKQAVKKAQREQDSRPYTRKCAVCGRTDTDNPGLEFRYCSRCQGYHCFCQDHINNHVHFTE